MFNRAEQVAGCTERVVNNERQVVTARERCQRIEVRNVKARISDRLKVDCLCVCVDELFKSFDRIALGKTRLDTETFECDLELIVCASVQEARRDEVVSGLKDIVQRDKLCCLSR